MHISDLSLSEFFFFLISRKSSFSPSNSMPVPLQTLIADYFSRRQLALVQPISTNITTSSRFSWFNLPNGWGIEEVPCSDGHCVDKHYYEPGTRNKFRSLRAVERYINGEECTPQSRSRMLFNNFEHPRYMKMIIYGGKLTRLNGEDLSQGQLAIVPSANTSLTTTNDIPDGWIVEEVPRRNRDHTDKKRRLGLSILLRSGAKPRTLVTLFCLVILLEAMLRPNMFLSILSTFSN